MTNVSEFKNLVAVDVMPCPDPLITREIMSALIDFCTKSWVVHKTINVTIGTLEDPLDHYEIDLSSYTTNQRVCGVRELYIDGVLWEAKKMQIIDDIPDWEAIKEPGVKYYWVNDDNTLIIYDLTEDYTYLTLDLVFKPTRSATQVESVLWEDWADTITARAKYKLMLMPNKDWSDPKMALLYEREWKRGLSKARSLADSQGTSLSARVPWKPFGEVM